jgi:DNA-binding beta-propeller fold protein YncE
MRTIVATLRRGMATLSLLSVVAACAPGTTGSAGASLVAETSAAASVPAATATASRAPRPSPTTGPTTPPPVDLGSRLKATIDGIAKPCALAATTTDLWVTGDSPSRLARIDPATNEIVSQVPMDGAPCGIAIGPDGRLWVALLSVGRVVAVDPATAKVVMTVDGLGTDLWDLKAGFGSIWVVDRTKRQLDRIDPVIGKVIAQVGIGPSGSGLALVDGAVWVVDDADATVRRIDPATTTITATMKLRRGVSWFADDGRMAIAVANRIDGSISILDAATASAQPSIEGPSGPLDGTVVGTRAYIPDGDARTLLEVDLASGTIAGVDRLEGALNPFVAEAAFGDVWVLDYGGKRIWRIEP